MKLSILIVTALLVASSAFAQAAPPNRKDEVRDLVSHYRALLDGSDDKGRVVTGLMCNDLNRLDGGQWGMLIKNDRNPPFVPYDILVWKPTREHFDVLSGVNPMWIDDGVIRPEWGWLVCPTSAEPPPVVVGPPPVVLPPPVGADVAVRLATIEQGVAEIRQSAFVNHTATLEELAMLSAQLKQHDENPMWLAAFFGNRYVQLGLAAFATWMTTDRVVKP